MSKVKGQDSLQNTTVDTLYYEIKEHEKYGEFSGNDKFCAKKTERTETRILVSCLPKNVKKRNVSRCSRATAASLKEA